VSGNNILAGTGGGIFYSADSGKTWTKSDFDRFEPTCFASTSNGILSGWQGTVGPFLGVGLELSTNNGVNWTSVRTPPSDPFIDCLAGWRDTVYVGTGSGIYKSTDYGTTWEKTGNGLPDIDNINVCSLTVFDSTIFAGTYEGVFRSTDGAASWQSDNAGLIDSVVYTFGVSHSGGSPSTIFAGTSTHVFRSSDKGLIWEDSDLGLPHAFVHSFAVIGTNIFAATDSGTFVSSDNGLRWVRTDDGMKSTKVHDIVVSGANLIAGTDDGTFLSSNNGAGWTPVINGLTNTSISGFAAHNGRVFASADPDGLFVTTDSGTNWSRISGGPGNALISVLAVGGDHLFACADGGVYLSTDDGLRWSSTRIGSTDSVARTLAVSAEHVFAFSDSSVFLSTNSGEIWTRRGATPMGRPLSASLANGANLFAAILNSDLPYPPEHVLFVSTDSGATWSPADSALPTYSRVQALAANTASGGNSLFAGTWGSGVFRSTNNGTTWAPAFSTSEYSNNFVWSMVVHEKDVFVGTEGGVLHSSDNGAHWTTDNTGLKQYFVRSLVVSGAYLYAGIPGNGVWRRPLSEMVTSVQRSDNAPDGFALEQNYPNPFNPSTTIQFSIPHAAHVVLRVFNTVGQEVATLASEELGAGTYTRQWNAAQSASGVFFYRLQAGGFTDTKELILVK